MHTGQLKALLCLKWSYDAMPTSPQLKELFSKKWNLGPEKGLQIIIFVFFSVFSSLELFAMSATAKYHQETTKTA